MDWFLYIRDLRHERVKTLRVRRERVTDYVWPILLHFLLRLLSKLWFIGTIYRVSKVSETPYSNCGNRLEGITLVFITFTILILPLWDLYILCHYWPIHYMKIQTLSTNTLFKTDYSLNKSSPEAESSRRSKWVIWSSSSTTSRSSTTAG